jgi:hypothetical protein
MTTIARILLGVLAGALAAGAQTAAYDTSLLKEGNTWTYSVSEERWSMTFGQETDYKGISRFTIDSLEFSADSVRFRVTHTDSGTGFDWMQDTLISNGDTLFPARWGAVSRFSTSRSRFTFRNNAYSPHTPFPFVGQAFTPHAARALYQGDTVFRNQVSVTGCTPSAKENLQGVGRIRDEYAYHCSPHTRGHAFIRLISFNGVGYDASDVTPVALSAAIARAAGARAARLTLRSGGVRLEKNGRLFDLQGKSAPASPASGLEP